MYLSKFLRSGLSRRGLQSVRRIINKKPQIKSHLRTTHTAKCLNTKTTYLIDEIDSSDKNSSVSGVNKFTDRTHTCGELRIDDVGQQVVLCGWLEYQRMNRFIVVRDAYGHTQLLVKEDDVITSKKVRALPYETIVKLKGTVQTRPKDMINPQQSTGEIEVLIESLVVLNYADMNLPFNIREYQKAKEALRLQYRYLDLRFSDMQKNLRVRSDFLMNLRTFLVQHCNFVDVETPTLFKATPGGAQEFKVPTRFPGQFYSLVQSPQQFKQMLMAGAIDRYFQIARCYRDEGIRSDRQPEFTQLDIELSFTSINHILELVEKLLRYSWPEFLSPLPLIFPKITYEKAMALYGSDKPDVRFDFKLIDLTDLFKNESHNDIYEDNFGAYCVHFNHPYCNLTSRTKTKLLEIAKKMPDVKFVPSKVAIVSEWLEKISNLIGQKRSVKIAEKIKLENDSVLFLAYGNKLDVQKLLGFARIEYAKQMESKGHKILKEGMFPVWVIDFPLFEIAHIPQQQQQLNSAHHPFTAPHKHDEYLLESNPLKVRAQAYDLVLNGNEVGGGSIRIHDRHQQEKILKMLNIPKINLQHMLDMLGSGCPPHGGIALGLDRLLAVMLNTSSIRDVIAFPKSFEGRDPLSGAPSSITDTDKKLYHIEVVKNNDNT